MPLDDNDDTPKLGPLRRSLLNATPVDKSGINHSFSTQSHERRQRALLPHDVVKPLSLRTGDWKLSEEVKGNVAEN